MTDTTTETWVYAGRRTSARGKLAKLFIDGAGNELLFLASKTNATAVGGEYEVKVIRTDEVTSIVGDGRYLDQTENSKYVPLLEEWSALDRAAYTRDAADKREKNAPDNFGDMTLRELAHLAGRLPSPSRTALVAQLIQYINRGERAT